MELAYPTNNPLLGIVLGTFFGAALGYLLRTAVRVIRR